MKFSVVNIDEGIPGWDERTQPNKIAITITITIYIYIYIYIYILII